MPRRTDDREFPLRLTRRQALGLGAGAVASTMVTTDPVAASAAQPQRRRWEATARRRTVIDALRPEIRPRSEWAGELQVKGELAPEDDVRFLLVHHTASSNAYGPDQVVDQIRTFYELHTGPEKGWADVAYNFLVDRYGTIWEARAGSTDGPVRGDATGGSQGFALLCCSIGDHTLEPMTPEATDSMVRLLAWLGERYGVDTAPGATVTFTSRGSSLHPVDSEVTANTISGHRDMSSTTCPGDFVYAELQQAIPAAVTRTRLDAGGGAAAVTSSTGSTTSSSTEAPASASTPQPAAAETTVPSSTTSPPDRGGSDPDTGTALAASTAGDGDDRSPALIGAGLVAGAIAAGGALVNRLLRRAGPS